MGSSHKDQGKNKIPEVKTFSVPFPLVTNPENITITTKTPSKPAKEQIINQAFKFHSQGKISEAIKYYQYLIKEGYKDHRFFSNYGVILKNQGKLDEAEIYQRKAIELKPDLATAHSNLGNILRNQGKLKEAESSTRKAIELKPNDAEAYSNLGVIFKDLGKLHDAESSQRKAIELKPDFATAHSNLGNILKDLGKLKEAELSTRKAIELNPNYADAYSNLGIILRDQGKLKEAELSARKAIELNPDFADAIFLLCGLQMIQDDYLSGLKNYESRFEIKQNRAILHAQPKIPRWRGESAEKGEKLLIVSEQGLGDTIHFMRYIPYLREKGYKVILCAQEALYPIIKESGIESNLITRQQANKILDGKYCPLLSLPLHLGVNQNNPIVSEPYISTKRELTAKWKDIFKEEKRPIIGISWQGNPSTERGHVKGRSIALKVFSKLAKTDKFRFLSLQKDFGSEQMEQCSFKNKFVKFQKLVSSTHDFLDTAAHIQNCDLIITTDSCLAHLAGGMGKTTWVLLKAYLTWRYGLDDTTFWYPSMKLFHQKEKGNWDEVIDRIAIELEDFLINKN